jgi:hypothetical protein
VSLVRQPGLPEPGQRRHEGRRARGDDDAARASAPAPVPSALRHLHAPGARPCARGPAAPPRPDWS